MREIKFLLLPQWFCQVLLDTEPVLISQLKSLKGAGTYASLVQIWLQSLLPLDHEFVFLKLYNNYYNSFKGLNIWRLHFPRLSSTSYLLLFTSLTCTETSRQVLLFSPPLWEVEKPGWPFHMTYRQTDARADINTGRAPLQGLGRETPLINVWPRPSRLRMGSR